MAKYIDADRLQAEIKRQIRLENLNFAALGSGGQTFCINTLEWVLKQIDSLQQGQSEVDLEVRKQIEELANDWHHKGFASDEDCPLCMQDLMDNLWHFYELGKNSK